MSATDSYSLSAMEYSEIFGTDLKNSYTEIRIASENLYDRELWLTSKDGNPVKTRWLTSIEYGDGVIKVQFADKIIPYLSNMSKEYTKYRLSNIAKLTTPAHIRFYEFISQWKMSKNGIKEISIDQFKKVLGFKPTDYPQTKIFKRNILKRAIHQVNETTDINVSYQDIKKGRSITGFKFFFGEDSITQVELEDAIADAKNKLM